MRALALALAVAGCTPAHWTARDTYVETGVGLTIAADYLQTRQLCSDMARGTNADWVYETNRVIGHDCDRVPPEVYFPIAMAAHVGAARLLPRWARLAFQVGTTMWQFHAISRNVEAGYTIRF